VLSSAAGRVAAVRLLEAQSPLKKRGPWVHADLRVVTSSWIKMHMAAVNPACTDVPVRSFGTFTQHLHDLADWFKACGVTSVADGIHRDLLDPCLRDPGAARL